VKRAEKAPGYLRGDSDTGFVGLDLADIVELGHPVTWLDEPFLHNHFILSKIFYITKPYVVGIIILILENLIDPTLHFKVQN
jgi:hypothetical protein